MAASSITYLDNATTTLMADKTLSAFTSWCNQGNPMYVAKQMIDAFRREIAIECSFELDMFDILFTSGASESNCYIITSAVRSYSAKTGRQPHVITSAAEHKSLLTCCMNLAKEKFCQLTVLPVKHTGPLFGTVDPDDLIAELRPNTCIVSIIAANHETGILSNLRELTKITRSAHVPFHTDAAQLFGKTAVRPISMGVDAFSASFHKIGGPPGIGILVIKRAFIAGYDLSPHSSGAIDNLPGIGASFVAFRTIMANRVEKNAHLAKLCALFKKTLAKHVPCFNIDDHEYEPAPSIDGITPPPQSARKTSAEVLRAHGRVVFWVSPKNEMLVLPNIVLMAVKNSERCSRDIRTTFERQGIIININITSFPIMRVHSSLIPIQISFSDDSTSEDVLSFVQHFVAL